MRRSLSITCLQKKGFFLLFSINIQHRKKMKSFLESDSQDGYNGMISKLDEFEKNSCPC